MSGAITTTRALRDTLGRYATGVAVITTAHPAGPTATTINSFTSVSLDPPLILWCLHRSSRRRPALVAATHFAVNILAADQHELAEWCATSATFPDVEHAIGSYGLPILTGTAGFLVCRRRRIVPAGDHVMLIAAVLEHRSSAGLPLLFLDGRYHTAR